MSVIFPESFSSMVAGCLRMILAKANSGQSRTTRFTVRGSSHTVISIYYNVIRVYYNITILCVGAVYTTGRNAFACTDSAAGAGASLLL